MNEEILAEMVQKIEVVLKKLESFGEEMDYKFDIVFDELYAIRSGIEAKGK